MRKLLAVVAVSALLATAAIGVSATSGPSDPGARTARHLVRVDDNFFSPSFKRRSRGRLVRWTWVGDNRHNVRGYRGQRFNSGSSGKLNGTYTIRLRAARGTLIRYICDFHPDEMRGRIRVR
jgi:plastocyanin